MKTEAEMLKYRNFGEKSLNEIKDKLLQLGSESWNEIRIRVGRTSEGQRTERGRQAGVVLTSYASREKYDQIGPESRASKFTAGKPGLQPHRVESNQDDLGKGEGGPSLC
jgi:Bacterial RNA polymerase, alpha chain C terminal domain